MLLTIISNKQFQLQPDVEQNLKPKFSLEDEFDDNSRVIEANEILLNPSVGVVGDDRKNRKRNVEKANEISGDEVIATVVELTNLTNSTNMTSTTEILATTDATTASGTSTTEESTTSISTTTDVPLETTTDGHFKPIGYYYGNSAFGNIDAIYFTTTNPVQEPSTLSTTNQPNLIHDRSDSSSFSPSVQYEYQNYRYNVDDHFIPIVGQKQIF